MRQYPKTPGCLVFALISLAVSASSQEIPPNMKTYQMVFFMTTAIAPDDNPDREKIQAAHLAGLARLNHDRINLLYGPFLDEGPLRGIAVLDVPDAASALKALADDPYVKAGYLVPEAHPWLGPKDFFSLPSDPPTPENFVLGFLMRGTHRDQPSEEAQKLQEGHLVYMRSLHEQGKLPVAGPTWKTLIAAAS